MHLNNTYGCLFVGILFAIILYGLGCAQTIYYARWYRKDPMWTKLLVAFTWLFDTCRTILDVSLLWEYTVTIHGNPEGLEVLRNELFAEFFMNSFTVVIVQLYFIYIVWNLFIDGRNRFRISVTAAAIALALLSFGANCGLVYRFSLSHSIAAAEDNVTVTASIATVTAVVTDIYITISLCLILSSKRTGYQRTEYFISALIGYAIRRGIFTALVQGLHFLTYISTFKQSSLYWMLFHFPSSKVYVNSMLAVLNVRKTVLEKAVPMIHADGMELEMDVVSRDAGSKTVRTASTNMSKRARRYSPAHIKVTRDVVGDDGRTVDVILNDAVSSYDSAREVGEKV
ncbi:uncharacterized protein LAESUDRAFT_720917 [Laetiporus sulphureus 93-53]|uniref:DUF6534 domain-containing protein n=1 Tax=Laetiporus sulphureus 93-53 TaxID=1314785 RepID=A0A165GNB1_9APHY|nr:uncharacterized protein LAESUDRAFT_720917 [Laetiporus sulphureus 93-53]KZT10583.1 hypothetical protein LAESUDRAFT_720917 [Laetiporus sulphureus 93-53]